MVLIFKTLVDLWRERLAHLDALLAKHPYDSWRLRAEHKVLEYLVRRYENDAPSWPLGPRSARRLDSVHEPKPVIRMRGLVRDARSAKDAPEKGKRPTRIFLSADARRNLQLWNPEVEQPLSAEWHREGDQHTDGLWHEYYAPPTQDDLGRYDYLWHTEVMRADTREMDRQLNLYQMDPNTQPPQPRQAFSPDFGWLLLFGFLYLSAALFAILVIVAYCH